MTGYGRGEAVVKGVRATVECSSVNRKQAEVVWSALREFASLEPLVRECVQSQVARGRVMVTAAITVAGAATALVDAAVARAYHAQLRALASDLDLPPPTLETVLAGPGVLRAEVSSVEAWPAVRKALGPALAELIAARAREGAHLARSLEREVRALTTAAHRARPIASSVPAAHRKALLARLARSGIALDLADPRLAAEIALFAERCDVTEELDRLDAHTSEFLARLAKPGPHGRALEFLTQEIGREWNTLGAKASSPRLARLVVDSKSAIDKIREQLANVE
jgi:uncharacterized protein (TIGR00255 family)